MENIRKFMDENYESFGLEALSTYEYDGVIGLMSKLYCDITNDSKKETYESLKKSLMDRFKQMYHASEERYADESAKMFAWMIDSWKREEESWIGLRKEYEQSLIREDKLRIQNLNILADIKKLYQYLQDGEVLKGETWMREFPQFCQELNINRA